MKKIDFLKIMSPMVKASIEMEKSKDDWIKKIHDLRNQLTENGTDTLIFREVLPDGAKGYFYKDLSLAEEGVEMVHYDGTPIWIEDISCYLHTSVNYSQDGEFFPRTYIYIQMIFYCQSNNSYVKENFPGKIVWRTYLFGTYLDWKSESKHKGNGMGFACKNPIRISSFSEAGWTMIFENNNLRKNIVKKLIGVESTLRSLNNGDKVTPSLIYRP